MSGYARRILVTVTVLAAALAARFVVLPGTPIGLSDLWRSLTGSVPPRRTTLLVVGLRPYFSAAVIWLLLSGAIDRLQRMREGTAEERRSFDRAIVRIALVLASAQALSHGVAFSRMDALRAGGHTTTSVPLFALSALGATTLLIVMAHIISRAGVGNGVAWVAFITLDVADLSDGFVVVRNQLPMTVVALAVMTVACCAYLGFREDVALVPIGSADPGSARESPTLPLRLDLVGVAPAFLASTVLGLPYLVSSFFAPSPGWPLLENAAGYWVLFAVLTLALSYLITGIGFDTRRVGPMLQRFGYRIAAVPEGQSTDAYLDRLIERRIPISAAVLITIVALPYALGTLMGIKLPLAGFTGPAVLAGCAIVLDAVRHARGLRVVEAEGPSGDPAESEGHEAATDETAPAGAAATADAEDLPPPEPWQEVFEADTELEANLAQAALSERGIQGVVLSNRVIPWLGTHALWEWTVPTYPNLAIHRRLGEGRVVVRVREHEATRARELLAPFAGAAIPAEAPPS